MRQLQWDDELAEVAQRWADRCLSFYTHGPHDACRDLPRFPVGQNIVSTAYSKPAASDVRARTLDWYGELAFFDPAVVRRFAPNPDPDPAKQIGHYTQMVWGWTYAIGCARVVFEEQFPEEAAPWVVER
ncbi:Venom allergen 3, partial [Gryllus bimaculatus]